MLDRLLNGFKEKAGRLAYTSRLYNWTLDWPISGQAGPELHMTPVDPWPGQTGRGRWLCQGAVIFDNDSMPLEGNYWASQEASQSLLDHLHSFEWLRDLKSYGGETARKQGRDMIFHWIDHHPAWSERSCQPALLGRRVANWLAMFEFYGANMEDTERARILNSLLRQVRHLSRSMASENPAGIDLLYAAKGLVYAGLCFQGREAWLEQGLDFVEQDIPEQVLSDGGHVTRCPVNTLMALKICFEINSALARGGYQRLEVLQHAIDRLTPAVRFFRHGDKRFCDFHMGTGESEQEIDAVLSQVDGKIRIPKSLGHSGYERATAGRSILIMDTGVAAERPHDRFAHASPLAFEFSHGRERIFVNCGTHRTDPAWAELLRSSAAHNMLVLNDRNAFEIRADGHIGKRVGEIDIERFDAKGGMIIDASHTGYERASGLVHRRRVFLSQNGCDLRGEDTLEGMLTPGKQADVAIRFHLHPRVLVSVIQEGRECLLRTHSGNGWRFYHVGGDLRLENSVYLGEDGQIRKTKQIVLRSLIDEAPVMLQWALQKESA